MTRFSINPAELRELASIPKRSGDETGVLELLFEPGKRPSVGDVVRLFEETQEAGLAARISHRPSNDADWLEILSSGLTFDLRGLAPGDPKTAHEADYRYGWQGDDGIRQGEAVHLLPSAHIAAGAALPPVVRAMMSLAANLVLHFPVIGVGWVPSGTLMEPAFFSRMALNWLSGGAFPALGLTALVIADDGSVSSRGLAWFAGQEMQLAPRPNEAPGDAMKLAVRVVDYLARHGPLVRTETVETGRETLRLEPSQVGKLVLVWREE